MKKIRGFQLDTRRNNTTHYGHLYNHYLTLPYGRKKFRDRTLRVWVPEGFNIHKEYGVLYMSDGQNAVDENLTAYGEWNMEDHFHNLVKEGYPEFIIVGIDCARNERARILEYLPGVPNRMLPKDQNNLVNHGYEFTEYLVNEIVPYINQKFNINQDLVGFCGSSMGGLISFYVCSKHPEVFKFCISFSPAFFFYTKDVINQQMKMRNFNQDKDSRYAFFIGGADKLEKDLKVNTDHVVKKLKEAGYDKDHLLYIIDPTRIHHESTWSDFIEEALRFVLKDYKK